MFEAGKLNIMTDGTQYECGKWQVIHAHGHSACQKNISHAAKEHTHTLRCHGPRAAGGERMARET